LPKGLRRGRRRCRALDQREKDSAAILSRSTRKKDTRHRGALLTYRNNTDLKRSSFESTSYREANGQTRKNRINRARSRVHVNSRTEEQSSISTPARATSLMHAPESKTRLPKSAEARVSRACHHIGKWWSKSSCYYCAPPMQKISVTGRFKFVGPQGSRGQWRGAPCWAPRPIKAT